MVASRASSGLLVSAVGAAVVAMATYQPWYAVSITPAGAAVAQQQLTSVAHQYGSPALQSMANEFGSRFSAVAGQPLATVSARQALKHISTVLLVLAGVALLASLLRLAGMIEGSGGGIAVLGVLALFCVIFRMFVYVPNPAPGYIALSLSWGGWLALLGAGAVIAGGMRSPYSRL